MVNLRAADSTYFRPRVSEYPGRHTRRIRVAGFNQTKPYTRYRLFAGRQHQRHIPAFQFDLICVVIADAQIRGSLNNTLDYFTSKFLMGHFTSPEHNGDPDLVAFRQELPHMICLEIKIMFVNFGAIFNFFYGNGVLVFPGFPGAPFLLIAILAVIHNPAYGRSRFGRHLHQVKTMVFRFTKGISRCHNAQLRTIFINHAHLACADLVIDTYQIFLLFLGDG